MSEQELTAIVEQGDSAGCIAFFKGMPESQRRSLAPICLKLLKRAKQREQGLFDADMATHAPAMSSGKAVIIRTTVRKNDLVVAEAAVLATATFSELRAISWRVTREQDLVFALLADRRPDWTARWVETLLKSSFYWLNWPLVRRLLRAGVMPELESPNYIVAMISGLVRSPNLDDKSVEAHLLADPELLDDEVWRLFEHDGDGQNSLANWDHYHPGRTWHNGLIVLANSGRLPRERLLSSSLDALERDFNHYRARWFAAFHDALVPSPQELREHAPRYLRLVSARAPNIASWALEIVRELAEDGVYEASTLIAGLRPALTSRQRALAKRAIELLDGAAQSSLEAAREAVRAVVTALGHEATDVQTAALDLIDNHASAVDSELATTIAGYATAVAASLRTRLIRWRPGVKEKTSSRNLSAPPTSGDQIKLPKLPAEFKRLFGIENLLANIEAGRAEIPAATFDGTEIPRLKDSQRLTPIADLDELIDVCARVVEDEQRVDDAERAFDGLSRLCDQKPGDFARRVGPLAKRVTQRLQNEASPFLGKGPGDDLCGLAYVWTTGHWLGWDRNPDRFDGQVMVRVAGALRSDYVRDMWTGLGYLSRRSIALAKRVAAGRRAVLLSAPTHAGGWIAPHALAERVNASTGDEPDLTDVCLAMLRLAPEGRAEALNALREVPTECVHAIRYALGAPRVTLGKTAALWVAAARARAPWADDERVVKAFPDYGPDAGRKATYSVSVAKVYNHMRLAIHSDPPPPVSVDPDCVTVILHAQRNAGRDPGWFWKSGGAAGRTVGSVRWTATIWPQARESLFAAAAETIAANIDWEQAAWQNKSLLEPLLDCGTPLRPMALTLLATALAAKEPGEYGLATDIAIRAIEEGRLGSDNLGLVLAQLFPTGLIKPGRWHKTLAEVARASPVHGMVIHRALQAALHDKPDKLPRDFAKLVELLHELSIDLDLHIADDGCRAFLQRIVSGKSAKIAKNLLNLPASSFSTTVRPIMLQAIEQRAAAVESLTK